MLHRIHCYTRHTGGATAPEYGLIAAGVAMALIVLAAMVGGEISETLAKSCYEISHQNVC